MEKAIQRIKKQIEEKANVRNECFRLKSMEEYNLWFGFVNGLCCALEILEEEIEVK